MPASLSTLMEEGRRAVLRPLAQASTLPPGFYTSPEIFEAERERLARLLGVLAAPRKFRMPLTGSGSTSRANRS